MCATCGGPLSRQGKIYCSWACSNGRAGTRAGSRSARACEICGSQFKPKPRSGCVQRTCSRACGVELRRREGTLSRPYVLGSAGPACPVWVRDCAQCGTLFVARRLKQVTCSRICGRRLNWAVSNLARRNGATEHVCPCGAVIPLKRWKCDACLAADKRVQRQRKRRAERARKRSAKREPYTLAEIAARDRYRCMIPDCDYAPYRRVAMTKAVPHPKAPTIDHVVPLSISKDDTRANVQLAHFSCNARKHTGGSQQLALIG